MTPQELLDRKYNAGSIVINCVQHSGKELTSRPDDCDLCLVDLRNAFSRAVRVNEWLNDWKTDAETLLREDHG